MQIAQDISLRMYVKKRRRSGLRRGFLACIIREIAKSRCVSYFSTVPKVDLSVRIPLLSRHSKKFNSHPPVFLYAPAIVKAVAKHILCRCITGRGRLLIPVYCLLHVFFYASSMKIQLTKVILCHLITFHRRLAVQDGCLLQILSYSPSGLITAAKLSPCDRTGLQKCPVQISIPDRYQSKFAYPVHCPWQDRILRW